MKKERASLEAIESVYRARGADFFRFALAKTGDSERARDAVQEGFARAIRSRETLSQRQRDALFLRYYLDFDYRTIAETLGIEVGTVSATLHAARAALGHALQEAPR